MRKRGDRRKKGRDRRKFKENDNLKGKRHVLKEDVRSEGSGDTLVLQRRMLAVLPLTSLQVNPMMETLYGP